MRHTVNEHGIVTDPELVIQAEADGGDHAIITVAEVDGRWYYGHRFWCHLGGSSAGVGTKYDEGFPTRQAAVDNAAAMLFDRLHREAQRETETHRRRCRKLLDALRLALEEDAQLELF